MTGAYDNTVNIWTHHGKAVISVKDHTDIVKGVTWIDQSDPSKGFVSVSHDQTGLIWQWEPGTNNATAKISLRGHERGIDSVGVSPDCSRLATGG